MYIIHPNKRYRDGNYYVDYGAAGLAMENYLRWRYIHNHYKVATIIDDTAFFGLYKFQRYEVVVDWDKAKESANQQIWSWYPKFLVWMDNEKLKGEEVLGEVLCIAKRADQLQRTFRKFSNAVLKESIQRAKADEKTFEESVKMLQNIKTGAEMSLGILSAFTPAASIGKAALSAVDLHTKRVPLECIILNVGADLAIDIGANIGEVRKGFAIVAKSTNATVGAYMSGKDLPDSAVAGLAVLLGGATGYGVDEALKWIKAVKSTWTIPLASRGMPNKKALGALTSWQQVPGKIAEQTTEMAIKELFAGDNGGRGSGGVVPIQPSNVLVADIGHYEHLIRSNIYKLV
jgi:hypothetical protein